IPLEPLSAMPLEDTSDDTAPIIEIEPVRQLPRAQDEYDAIVTKAFSNREYDSNINIPLSHERYSRFDASMNMIGTNSHTASKPFLFKDVARYYDFENELESMERNTGTWLGKKIWNEHLVTFQGDNYWFTGDVVLDLQIGKDLQSDF